MSTEIEQLFLTLKELQEHMTNSLRKAQEATNLAAQLSGEFEQEIATDMEALQVNLEELIEELDVSIEEGKTLRDDKRKLEKSLRAGLEDEENYKLDSEHIQEDMREE